MGDSSNIGGAKCDLTIPRDPLSGSHGVQGFAKDPGT